MGDYKAGERCKVHLSPGKLGHVGHWFDGNGLEDKRKRSKNLKEQEQYTTLQGDGRWMEGRMDEQAGKRFDKINAPK